MDNSTQDVGNGVFSTTTLDGHARRATTDAAGSVRPADGAATGRLADPFSLAPADLDGGLDVAFDADGWVEPTNPSPRTGWRRLLWRASGGRYRPDPDDAEQRARMLLGRTRRPFVGARTVAVVSTKGVTGHALGAAGEAGVDQMLSFMREGLERTMALNGCRTIAEIDPQIVAVTAAMPDGTGLDLFGARFPARTFDVGIAEQHAVTFCAGMAAGGLKPVCAIYSTFLQRGYDQIVHDVAIQRLPVRFAIDRAGLVGADGATHAGSFDIAFLANLPGFIVMAAADEAELVHMLRTALAYDEGPSAFRFPRGEGVGVDLPERGEVLEIGRGRMIAEGNRVAILNFGTRLKEVREAAEALAQKGITPTIADARFAKPLDRDLILQLARHHEALITIEEGAVGGFGRHVAQLLAEEGVFDMGLKYRSMFLPDTFIDQASPEDMYAVAKMNAADIEAKVLDVLGVARLERRA